MSSEVSDFELEVVQKSRATPVVVDFWATWCGPCRVLGPILERLEKGNLGQWILAKVDTDLHQGIAQKFGIRGIPNVKLFVDGTPIAEFTGALPEPAIIQWLRENLPDPMKKEIDNARQLLTSGRTAEGIGSLENLFARAPDNHEVKGLLAGAIFPNDHARAAELVRGIEADSPQFPLADALRTVADLELKRATTTAFPNGTVKQVYLSAIDAMANNDFATALDGFIKVLRADKSYDEEGARRACVALFRILGDDNELTRGKRREFSSALFV